MIDGTLETIDGRLTLRFERRLEHSVQRVWRAITDPAELAHWFVAPVSWTPSLGETFGGEGEGGEITELQEPLILAWVWGDEHYRFELRPDGDGCILIFTHAYDDRYGPAAQHAAGWETYLARLAAHLAGGHLGEEQAHDPIGELHEAYAVRFDADPAPGRRMIASMAFRDLTLEGDATVRFERRYAHPIERVWRAITEPDELARWFPDGAPLAVTESDPPRLLAGTWHGDALRFALRSDDDGCVLVFTHAISDTRTAARDAAGWDRCFARLDARFAGSEMSERDALADWPAVHERLAERFGLDPEVGRRAFAAHPAT